MFYIKVKKDAQLTHCRSSSHVSPLLTVCDVPSPLVHLSQSCFSLCFCDLSSSLPVSAHFRSGTKMSEAQVMSEAQKCQMHQEILFLVEKKFYFLVHLLTEAQWSQWISVELIHVRTHWLGLCSELGWTE